MLSRPLRLDALAFSYAGRLALVMCGLLDACSPRAERESFSVVTPESLWGAPASVVNAPDHRDALLFEAKELHRRREYDRMLDALDPGELKEHATLSQEALNTGRFGLAEMFAVGDELFDYEFRSEDGLGNGLVGRQGVLSGAFARPNMRRVHEGDFGGPDAHSCASCHSKGGLDGAGTATQNAYLRGDGARVGAAEERNPPHLLGLGPIEALAREMTAELRGIRDRAKTHAERTRKPNRAPLLTKGVSFGFLTVDEAGAVDTREVRGVDADLEIRPFGWKGHQATLRGMVEESFRLHLGIVSIATQQRRRDGQDLPSETYGNGPWSDIDADGISVEIDDGMLSTMVAYLAQLEIPVMRPPRDPELLDAWARGKQLFHHVGCAACHIPALELVDTKIDIIPERSDSGAASPIVVDVAHDGEHPKIEPANGRLSYYYVSLFSDLKRHELGEELRSGGGSVYLTRPLWGLSDTAPYLHDGRAPTLRDAIVAHGGEATQAKQAYLELRADGQADLRVFLMSLGRTPKPQVP